MMDLSIREYAKELWEEYWIHIFVLSVLSLSFPYAWFALISKHPPLSWDSALYEYTGWYLTEGGVLYVDVWDIKPPLIFYTAAVISFFSGGDPLTLHRGSILVTQLVGATLPILTLFITYNETDSKVAAIAAGAATLGLTEVIMLGSFGLIAKFFCAAAGLGAILLTQRKQYLGAGMASAIATLYYQVGAVYVLVVLLMAIWDGNESSTYHPIKNTVVGGVGVTIVVLLPIIFQGAAWNFLAATVGAHLFLTESSTLSERFFNLIDFIGFRTFLIPVAIIGSAVSTCDRKISWILFGLVISGLHPFLLDLGGALDLAIFWTFVSLGVGIAMSRLESKNHKIGVTCLIIILLIISAPYASNFPTNEIEYGYDDPNPDVERMYDYFWNQSPPENCYPFSTEWERANTLLGVDTICQRLSFSQLIDAATNRLL